MTLPQRTDPDLRRQLFGKLAPQAGYRAGNLASICGVSLRQLERYFHQDFGCPPGRWLRKQRIRTACHLLDSAQSVKEVAFSLGFGSVSHFSTQFKRATGICPSEYTHSLNIRQPAAVVPFSRDNASLPKAADQREPHPEQRRERRLLAYTN